MTLHALLKEDRSVRGVLVQEEELEYLDDFEGQATIF